MKYKIKTFSNGLRVLFVPLPNLESASLTVWIGVGSRFEEKRVSGISHFLEHMAFKGGKKYPSAKAVSTAVDGIGAVVNASTSKEWTNYYIKVRAEKLETGFDVLSDVLFNPLLKQDDIERERGVIIEEIARNNDTPSEKISDVFMELIFGDTPLGRDIAGTQGSVGAITKTDFEKYRDAHYGGKNMVITISGGVGEKRAFELAEKYFGSLPAKKKEKVKKHVGTQKLPSLKVHYKKSDQAHFILGFQGYPRGHRDRYTEGLLSAILGMGMSSRLFTEVREKRGLAYAVSTSANHFVDTGFFATYAGVDLKRIDEAIAVVLEQHYGIPDSQFPISDEELQKAKEYVKGNVALALEDTLAVNSFFGKRVLFMPEIETPEDFFAKIDAVTIAGIVRVAKDLFVPKKLNLAIIGPYKSPGRFRKLIEGR
jgi:predicted Zn-dependent peptidase